MKKEKEWLNIILVGSNPMPCYVQAAHLMDKAGWTEEEKENLFVPTRHLLIHTQETVIYKDRICSALESLAAKNHFRRCEIGAVCLQTAGGGTGGEVSQYVVEEKIKEILNRENPEGVILNHTGGTKVMTTYAAIALREWCGKNHKPGAECYLSGDRLNCFLFNGQHRKKYLEFPVSNVLLTVKDIVRLHGMEICGEKSADEQTKELLEDGDFCRRIKSIAARMFSGSDSDAFSGEYLRLKAFLADMCNSEHALYFRSLTCKSGDCKAADSNIGERCAFIFPDKSRRFEQYTALLEQYGKKNPWLYFDKKENCFKSGTGEGGDMADLLNQAREKGLDCWELFMEDWFYYYVCCAVREAFSDLRKDYETISPAEPGFGADIMYRPWIQDANGGRRFDILFSTGYQLTVLSITGGEQGGSVKMNFFEALYQSEKIGGSRSRVVLISRFTNRDTRQTYEKEFEAFRKDLDSFVSKQYHQAVIFGQEEVREYSRLVEALTEGIKK